MTTKAEVETLTAEVKTLVVGNRQITLSVARQLDEVSPWELSHVFGRIKLDNSKPRYNGETIGEHIIGKHRETGALVTANIGEQNQGWVFRTILGPQWRSIIRNEPEKLSREALDYVELFYHQPKIVLAGLK